MKAGYIYKHKEGLTKQIFVEDTQASAVLQMATQKQDGKEEKHLTVDDFKKPLNDEDVFDTKINYVV